MKYAHCLGQYFAYFALKAVEARVKSADSCQAPAISESLGMKGSPGLLISHEHSGSTL